MARFRKRKEWQQSLPNPQLHQKQAPRYPLGSPLVEGALIHLESGKTLRIQVHDQGSSNVFVQRVEVNGRELDRLHLTHQELVEGGVVEFFMGSEVRR